VPVWRERGKKALINGPEDGAGAGKESVPVSAELNALCRSLDSGGAAAVSRLREWAIRQDWEAKGLRRRLRKQEHDFATLFEIVSQTSARSLDLVAMQTYLLRTISGHFGTPKLLIVRRLRDEDQELGAAAAQGLRDVRLHMSVDSPLCAEALKRRAPVFLDDWSGDTRKLPELMALREMDLELAVPMIQEIEAPSVVLEGFLVLGPRLAQREYSSGDLEFLNVLAKMLAICLRNEALYRRSIVDDLTGLSSRGHFDARLVQELNRVKTYGHGHLGLLMLDIDQFKRLNDAHGHQTGDRVLQELSRVMVQQVRNVDLVARYGGEEFAVIVLEVDRRRLMHVAERIRKAVEEMRVQSTSGEDLQITASFGVACYPDDAEDKFGLIEKADQALYKAKDLGRNRVIMASPRTRRKMARGKGAKALKRRQADA
jgi:diguanylate cyclase (GGDEF)-like protein